MQKALQFFKASKRSFLYEKIPIKYVCGHSLGGIIAKIIAPQTGCHTCAFNSPGVLEYMHARKWSVHIKNDQVIRTYVANRDEVGEMKYYAELGERVYLATTDKNKESEVANKKLEDITEENSQTYAALVNGFKTGGVMPFHSMKDLFLYLRKNNYDKTFLAKAINYAAQYENFKRTKKRLDVYAARKVQEYVNTKAKRMF
ncbi:hypothetical protein [Fluviispira vulneris]|uniref:hypothetical protein n=1 Tax=Fluviispira vulneris TaxID=2763012 RepID=UPI001C96CBA6|nr:hypothetical protein [Fluviispira vulneris]